ncbi:hypothetical protein [Flavobacterium ajazii]|uniref:hypothetical protein n=1 Tax=Flavobacterium ajazii TaxID=2692318 RepID=UPI0013D27E03|nr:hypothetical protein [Flavobacterium ajazii]
MNNLVGQVASMPNVPSSNEERMFYERHLHDMAHSKQNMEERKMYASLIFQFTVLWCFGLFIILVGCGLEKLKLSDTVITAFIGSTTINVFVFFKLVTEYLFNKEKPHE